MSAPHVELAPHVDVAAYAIGSLAIEEAEHFECHLRTCGTCPDELAWLSQMIYLLTMGTPGEVS